MKQQQLTQADGIAMGKALLEELRKQGFPVHQVFLFGSLAKKTPHAQSDIDLAIVYEPFSSSRTEEERQLWKAEGNVTDIRTETIYLRLEDLENKYSTLAQEIKTHGISVGDSE